MVTIYFPDVSHYQSGLTIEPGTVAVCAKASEGSSTRDSGYSGFKSKAAAQKAFFFAYHFLHHGNAADQAKFCHGIVGSVPVMIDCEHSSSPTVADCVAFARELRLLGGLCTLVYLPHWFWQGNLGSPSLAPLASAGLSLVSSQYRAYSDTGAGWTPYGGLTPVIWQYSDSHSYGGQKVDFNAYRGTSAQLVTLISGTPTPKPVPSEDDDVTHLDLELSKPKVLASPTAVGGVGLLTLSSDFGDAVVRVALKRASSGWDVHRDIAVKSGDDPVQVAKVDKSITKISVRVESLTDPTTTIVGLDLFPDRSY